MVLFSMAISSLRFFLARKKKKRPTQPARTTKTATAAIAAELLLPLLSAASPLTPARPTWRPNSDWAAVSCNIRPDSGRVTATALDASSCMPRWAAMKALTSLPVIQPRIGARRQRVVAKGAELGMREAFPNAKISIPST